MKMKHDPVIFASKQNRRRSEELGLELYKKMQNNIPEIRNIPYSDVSIITKIGVRYNNGKIIRWDVS